MIEALFNQPNYLAAKKTLDAVAIRQEAIAGNLANLETPGYKRVDVAPSFQMELQRACSEGDSQTLASLKPSLTVDTTAISKGLDGNTVSLEQEMAQLDQNTVLHSVETQMVSTMLQRLKLAISGKNS